MKKYLIFITVINILTCSTIWAKSIGGPGMPFCNVSDAISKVQFFFNDDIAQLKKNTTEKTKEYYSNFFIQRIDYTNSYISVNGNLLNNEYCWVIKYVHAYNGSHTFTLALKKEGAIKVIAASK
jgi:hypothetical protein